ncbi:MAG: type VI secretion system baseplate subunit TssF [Candidatus Azobacteroides sp.]|nr:type VI secretion system baseplate subunit TssF [Candidatus Azobacteroides sp.]
MTDYTNSKETILQRLYNHAASLWNIQSIEDLDPIVKIMMEGLASNLYDLINEIEEINVRVLESLATVLTPSILINPRPAHAVAQAYPSEPVAFIDKRTVFSDKKISPELQKHGIKSFSFVPVNNKVRLVSGKINCLITERFFCRIEENGEKAGITQARTISEKLNHTVWIGMDLHPEVETFQGISFYIDFPLAVGKYDKLKILPYSRWSIDEQILEMKTGLPYLPDDEEEYDSEGYDAFFNKYSLLNQSDDTISDFYRIQYLTVSNDVRPDTVNKTSFPAEISDLFPERISAGLPPCYWIKIILPAHISVKDIHDIKIYLNTFPVANKTLYSLIRSLSNTVSGIVPLRTKEGEHFISVEKVSDSYGKAYKAIPYKTNEKSETGFYSIKRGGVERFDRRDAVEHIERMIDLIRDEIAVFKSLGMESMQNTLQTVEEGLNQIIHNYESNPVIEFAIPYYLVLEKIDKDETVFVEYWGTQSELANGLRSGKMLTPLSTSLFRKDSCRLLTQTRGGKSEANVTGKTEAFRYVLTSRDQINTFEDVSNFCRMELGEKITQVRVTRGVTVSSNPKEGLIRTVDVNLRPSPGYEPILRDMETDLLVMLHRKSSDTFNYRILIEGKT